MTLFFIQLINTFHTTYVGCLSKATLEWWNSTILQCIYSSFTSQNFQIQVLTSVCVFYTPHPKIWKHNPITIPSPQNTTNHQSVFDLLIFLNHISWQLQFVASAKTVQRLKEKLRRQFSENKIWNIKTKSYIKLINQQSFTLKFHFCNISIANQYNGLCCFFNVDHLLTQSANTSLLRNLKIH